MYVYQEEGKIEKGWSQRKRKMEEAYPIGGVLPSPFLSWYELSTCSLNVVDLFTNKREAEEALAFKSTGMHKASTVFINNLHLQTEGEYCIAI